MTGTEWFSCPECGNTDLAYPVDDDGNWIRSTPDQDANYPYCDECGAHVEPIAPPSMWRKRGPRQPGSPG